MKVYIFGDSRGLGKDLRTLFIDDKNDVYGYSRENGFDIEQDYEAIIQKIESGSLVILNAYANGIQKSILKKLVDTENKIVVMGSIASRFPDSSMVDYTNNKTDLDQYFMENAVKKKPSNLLILNLSGKSYQSSKLVYDSIKFWLINSDVISISYKAE
jgi:hypothetical protein